MSKLHRSLSFLILALLGAAAQAQTPAAGRLLVATPALDDPNFSQTVLLILHHDQDGSIAVALNRPTWVDAAKTFPDADALASYHGTLFFGGPVAPTQLLIIFDGRGRQVEHARPLVGSVFWSPDTSLLADLDLSSADPPRVRLFAGYAQWEPGQLEDEIAGGSWRLLTAETGTIFTDDPEKLWDRLPVAGNGVTASLR
jgi:putative transcriptional regulator